MPHFSLLLPLLLAFTTPPAVDHVIVISVDGLRSDALLAAGPSTLPGFERLLAGAATLNARTDPDSTVTLPNHVGMVTGRLMLGPEGHRCTWNDLSRTREILHGEGRYVAGIFDVAHDHGVFTGVYVSKLKMALFDLSWNEEHGAPDTVPPDHGRDKIDRFLYVDQAAGQAAAVTDGLLTELARPHPRSLHFVHYSDPDGAGHGAGWDLTPDSPYLESVQGIDVELGRILTAIEGDGRLRRRTAIILTADHGGGAPHRSHTREEMWINYIIPFLVWTGDGGPAVDLYEHNRSTREDPGLGRPRAEAHSPPIRNADAANLALGLLGLPPVPGSTVNRAQDLFVTGLPSRSD